MSPVGLAELLEGLPGTSDPNLLVGWETSDDAAVYRLDERRALVLTADLITPPVDDPRRFGEIAAANALSDVYAMGGRPLLAIDLVAFPDQKLSKTILHGMVHGVASKVAEAGAVLAGGHSIRDEEPKLGLAVAGLVDVDRIWTNRGAQPGDALLLTKAIGTGVLFNANRKRWVSEAAMATCVESAAALNRTAAETLQRFDVHAATDVTGFGLLGHAQEVARGSRHRLVLRADWIPLLPEAEAVVRRGMSTGSHAGNRALVEASLELGKDVGKTLLELLIDPQTSGGLLVALPEEQTAAALQALAAAGVAAAVRIGSVGGAEDSPSLRVE